jgi:DNA-binding transcriptional MerR regulator
MPAEQILTIPQIAQLTNRTVDTVRYWRLHGNGPKTFRSNNRVYAYKSDVLAWLDARAEPEDVRGGIA